MNSKLFTITFQHWHWNLPTERRFLFTNENTPCVSPIKNRSKGAISPWKCLRIIQLCQKHCGNWSLKTKRSMPIHLIRKKRTNPQPSVGRFYVSFSNVSPEYSGHLSLKIKMSMLIHLARNEPSTPLAIRKNFIPASQMRFKNTLATRHAKQK